MYLLSLLTRPCRACGRILLWTVAAAALLAPLGMVAGAFHGVAQHLLDGTPRPLLEVVLHFTACAAGVGALLGAFLCMVDGENPLATSAHDRAARPEAPPPARRAVELPAALAARRTGLPAALAATRGKPGWNWPSRSKIERRTDS